MEEKIMSTVERPYVDILSVRGYAKDILHFEESDMHRINLSLVSRTIKNGPQAGKPALVLHIDGDVKQADGSYKSLQATAWCGTVPTDEEVEEYASPVYVADATLRWGAFPNKDGVLEWAKEPKLRSWITEDGESRSPQSGERYDWE